MTRLTPRNIELADEDAVALFRRMTPAQKLHLMGSMFATARRWVETSVRQLHPMWSEGDVRREVARRVSHGEIDGPI